MAYTLTQLNASKWRFQAQVGQGTVVLDLDSSIPNGLGALHGQIIDIVTTDQVKADHLGELLEWNSNFAFAAFCIANQLVIPPDGVAPEPPIE